MKPVVKFVICIVLLAVACRAEDAGVHRSVKEHGVVLECSMSATNLLAGGTAVLQLEVTAPAAMKIEFKKLAFDGFLVFGEEHPAYTVSADGSLVYRHEYHLQARVPGPVSVPEVKIRFTNILKGTDARELVLPPLPVTVRGLDVKKGEELQWSDPVEVSP